jgi:hypothetical protein
VKGCDAGGLSDTGASWHIKLTCGRQTWHATNGSLRAVQVGDGDGRAARGETDGAEPPRTRPDGLAGLPKEAGCYISLLIEVVSLTVMPLDAAPPVTPPIQGIFGPL